MEEQSQRQLLAVAWVSRVCTQLKSVLWVQAAHASNPFSWAPAAAAHSQNYSAELLEIWRFLISERT